MAKKILLIFILLVITFSLMAQWTCETIDPEFDDAIIKAVNHWKFLRSKHIKTVTIPFVFYERDESSSSK